jgi:hypothetical protein
MRLVGFFAEKAEKKLGPARHTAPPAAVIFKKSLRLSVDFISSPHFQPISITATMLLQCDE